MEFSNIQPILKWAGGKRFLLPSLCEHIPKTFNKYFEPFLGSGALFFYLQPQNGRLSDLNAELINFYCVIRDYPEEFIHSLKKHQKDKEYFLQIRQVDRLPIFQEWSNIEKASRFYYLNRTCFNGLYRVNKKGYFNVPYGAYVNPKILDAEHVRKCSKILQNIEIVCESFSEVIGYAEAGDFVYFDPPYAPLNSVANFTAYTKEGFNEQEQKKLKEIYDELNKKGVFLILSNSDTHFIRHLYKDYNIKTVWAPRRINSNPSKRHKITELIITNF